MLILGIESATQQVGCALGGHEGVLASAHSARGRRHAEAIAPQVQFVAQQARVELQDVSCVAVDLGPGLYTGLRVGISSAMAIAYALGVPMIGVSSLDLLAFAVRHTNRLIVAAIDARRSELFYACYRQVPGGIQRITKAQVGTPHDLATELSAANEEKLLVGDGARRYCEDFDRLQKTEIAEQGLAHPSASSLVQLAHARALREEFVKPWELKPIYLRMPDADINWNTHNS
ncbi:MAG: tRNA (adenosine(37)-N6)-threonylcarbamoyltransferase complex dimerization subunit type 1 TsaB [Acidimicrobiia bacterium]|nr:tRNA (adenosine(37)-N6)-threonylcarbamoyltransferase complex dimerization subunit type 1 TsaB [Acidimicrobiia bacterium]MYC58342.1 tRNA (adenosine(37)-N6)-threonylcarbamoyltransferase complex dimerization subunit type 1 TsaB [Acidimicrobiia bacterium]MYG93517.1 tRNA (adenosine(37)-N6)-threonylcarbamoyltransferase complex dimerization subunit type 1 TsaB [Acidimicrobiia bacterium]MYI29951.1 tRNA (adenosine(37)-N6)-threonylcarbamoyltransferase complex dimerization subunit type 1 TsaB [Acidimicr